MSTHTISVMVEDGRISVTPDPLEMHRGSEVRWTGTNSRKFSIEFQDDGPLASRKLDHSAATKLQKATRTGRFKYTVVSDENPGLRLDPVIVVGDPSGG
jgi:plastocyanin